MREATVVLAAIGFQEFICSEVENVPRDPNSKSVIETCLDLFTSGHAETAIRVLNSLYKEA